MKHDFYINIAVFMAICFLIYVVFSNVNKMQEGLANKGTKKPADSTPTSSNNSVETTGSWPNGIAGNSAGYGANVKSQVIKLQDTLLISKYRSDYENVVLNMDDLVNNLMLQTVLTIDRSFPQQGLQELVNLHQSKTALNDIMKFIDSS